MRLFPSFSEYQQQFDAALDKAHEIQRPILIEFGGDWCKWSHRMHRLLASKEAQTHLQQVIYLRCPVEQDGRMPIEEERDIPTFDSVPFFVLLDPEGCVIDSQNTEPFERLWFYKKRAIYDYIDKCGRYPNIPLPPIK